MTYICFHLLQICEFQDVYINSNENVCISIKSSQNNLLHLIKRTTTLKIKNL